MCSCATAVRLWGLGVTLLVGRWPRLLLLVVVVMLVLVLHCLVGLLEHVLAPWLPGLGLLLWVLRLLALPRCCPCSMVGVMGSSRRRGLQGRRLRL